MHEMVLPTSLRCTAVRDDISIYIDLWLMCTICVCVRLCVRAAVLRVETVSFDSVIRIQSDMSREYICFNKRGRLTVRVGIHGDWLKKLSMKLDSGSNFSVKQSRIRNDSNSWKKINKWHIIVVRSVPPLAFHSVC